MKHQLLYRVSERGHMSKVHIAPMRADLTLCDLPSANYAKAAEIDGELLDPHITEINQRKIIQRPVCKRCFKTHRRIRKIERGNT